MGAMRLPNGGRVLTGSRLARDTGVPMDEARAVIALIVLGITSTAT